MSQPSQPSPVAIAAPTAAQPPQVGGFRRKTLLWIGGITLAVWAFAIQTGSTILMIIVGVLTLALAALLLWVFRRLRRQRAIGRLLEGATASPEARRDALAALSASKDASSPTSVFARAHLLAGDDPRAALDLLDSIALREFPAAMQDDVALLKAQLYLQFGATADARKCADWMNLDNPERTQIRPYAASIVAEALARTGKPKEALALLDSIEPTGENAEQIALQARIARVFARFAANQRNQARAELIALADDDVQHLGRFLAPQFRVHPELQKLARQVAEQRPGARRMAKAQRR